MKCGHWSHDGQWIDTVCFICRAAPGISRNHDNGQFAGMICDSCHQGGKMERDPRATALLVREYEMATCGTEEWHKHNLGLIYTDGMKFVADVCGAFWLLDAVASWQPDVVKVMKRHNLRPFQVWRLHYCPHERSNPQWVLDCWSDTPGYKGGEDGPASVELASQEIGYSDFPAGLAPFEFWVEGEVALLKGEH